MATGQDLYGLCLCLERYPEVFDAFYTIAIARVDQGTKKESFASRRARTRAARIKRYGK